MQKINFFVVLVMGTIFGASIQAAQESKLKSMLRKGLDLCWVEWSACYSRDRTVAVVNTSHWDEEWARNIARKHLAKQDKEAQSTGREEIDLCCCRVWYKTSFYGLSQQQQLSSESQGPQFKRSKKCLEDCCIRWSTPDSRKYDIVAVKTVRCNAEWGLEAARELLAKHNKDMKLLAEEEMCICCGVTQYKAIFAKPNQWQQRSTMSRD